VVDAGAWPAGDPVSSHRDLARMLEFWCRNDPDIPDPTPELRFHSERAWRFDLAWPQERVAAEVHGGEWSRGRHTRGAGLRDDCEKLTAAVIHGWRVLLFVGDDVKHWQTWCLERIRAALTGAIVPFEIRRRR